MAHQGISVKIDRQVDHPFVCGGCGYRGTATIKVQATGDAIVGATRRDAEEIAAERANKLFDRLVANKVALLGCPKCGWQDPVSVRRFRIRAVAFGAFGAVAATGLMAAWAKSTDVGLGRLAAVLGIASGLVAALALVGAVLVRAPQDAIFRDAAT